MKRIKCNTIKIIKEEAVLGVIITSKGGGIKNIKITRDRGISSDKVLFVDSYVYKIKGNSVKELEFEVKGERFLFTTNTKEL